MANLKTGTKAPGFEVESISGQKIKLPEEEKWVYVSFHRYSACPLCNLRTHELIKHYPEFSANKIVIYSIWPSTNESMLEFIGKNDSPFPLIADPKMKLFKLYKVIQRSKNPVKGFLRAPLVWMRSLRYLSRNFKIDGDMRLHPAGFLINPAGLIEIAYYGKHFSDHIAIEELIQHVKHAGHNFLREVS